MAGKARVVSFDRPALGFSPLARDGSVGLGWAGGETRAGIGGTAFLLPLPSLTRFPEASSSPAPRPLSSSSLLFASCLALGCLCCPCSLPLGFMAAYRMKRPM